MWDPSTFLGTLTPKFYVALTGTSSLISGLILIFEWWYFRKYGTSFIEQMSLAQLSPWLGGPEPAAAAAAGAGAGGAGGGAGGAGAGGGGECKVWRNPLALLRGAEYGRLWRCGRRAPLTYYDMNLSAQDHQAWFGCGAEGAAEEAMSRAWREREPAARVAAARAALLHAPDCAPALLLLAEEDAPTVHEAERMLRRAWRAAEAAWRVSSAGAAGGAEARRDAAVLAHVKRRAAMCARRLGRLRDAARLFRELARDAPPALHALALHENLLEVLLEQRAYADAQAVLARYDDGDAPRSAALCYTAALLRARAAAGAAPRAPAELAALEAMRRAIEFNPHVPEYLLELRALTLPPEHVLKRGDSEAVAYAFFHLRHWRHAEGALRLLAVAWQAAGGARGAGGGGACAAGGARGGARGAGGGGACAACADRELLPPHHLAAGGAGGAGGCAPAPRRAGALLPLAAGVCAAAALAALLAHGWPSQARALARAAAAGLDPRRLQGLLSAV
ncbi:protein ST7 homolog [Achroia grisella]|uniref:protein ST7 homolog n=1 Tax=Achroia grisella TaxID=688607 RepID=UPI0027D22F2E|nr:protein ST7 homolog [Achroia grisella]